MLSMSDRPADHEPMLGKRGVASSQSHADAEGQFHHTMPIGQTHADTNPNVQAAVQADARAHMPSKAS